MYVRLTHKKEQTGMDTLSAQLRESPHSGLVVIQGDACRPYLYHTSATFWQHIGTKPHQTRNKTAQNSSKLAIFRTFCHQTRNFRHLVLFQCINLPFCCGNVLHLCRKFLWQDR